MNKKEIEIDEFEMHLKKCIVCLRSNLSNYHIISAMRPGLKTGVKKWLVGVK